MARRPDYMAWIVLGGLLAVVLIGWLVFPSLQKHIAHEDCIGHGATNCG